MSSNEAAIARLRQAHKERELTLYLGAGVSVANGLPTWDKLVLAMYYAAISEEKMSGWRPFPNYLFAIAEWHLKRGHEPLEIIARKVRKYYPNQDEFLKQLRLTLYQGFLFPDSQEEFQKMDGWSLRQANRTLDAAAKLCEAREDGAGARSVISYNYDCLLEESLKVPYQPIFHENDSLLEGRLPIYHVHGYVPIKPGSGSKPEEIVFTEDQYHRTAQDVYSWANLTQIQAMSRSVGLMIGLSLSDRNMRRLLDAIAKAPVNSVNFALLQRPQWDKPSDDQLDGIQERAIEYIGRFERSGIKSDSRAYESTGLNRGPGSKSAQPMVKSVANVKGEPRYRTEIKGILGQVERFDEDEQQYVLSQLGITPVWYDQHEEIPAIVKRILSPSGSV